MPAIGDDGPAALVPVRAVLPFPFALEASGGGVGVTALPDIDEFNSCRGRLLAAAVSNGGGCGRSRPDDEEPPGPNGPRDEDADFGDVSLVAELGLDIVSTVDVLGEMELEESVCGGTCSRVLNRACSASFESTISVVDVVLPKRLIFFARATSDERRRSRTPGGGPAALLLLLLLLLLRLLLLAPVPPLREESSSWRGFDEARMTDSEGWVLKGEGCRDAGFG